MAAPPQGVCSPWVTLEQVRDQANCQEADVPDEYVNLAIPIASNLLYEATRRRFPGECEDTVRPCTMQVARAWYRRAGWDYGYSCGCASRDHCGCSAQDRIRLPRGPVTGITTVKVDGETLDAARYRVEDYRWLVRLPDADDSRPGWPCFPAATRVLTATGLKGIETIRPGEWVLTHRNRWRQVVRSGKTGDSELVQVVGRGGTVRATPDHGFWASEVHGTPGHRKLGAPTWVEAQHLLGSAWAMPASVEALPIPLPAGWAMSDCPEVFWWIVGRWLGDGWTSNRAPNGTRGGGSNRITICCGKNEADGLGQVLTLTGWRWRRTNERTVVRFRVCDGPLRDWLRTHFGTAAHDKRIPPWLLGANESIRSAVLDGYVSADGYVTQSGVSVHTVGRDLALGLRLLAATLGYAATSRQGNPAGMAVIEGRPVRTRATYRVDWPHTKPGGFLSQAWADEAHIWGRVRSVELQELVVPVYDLEVEEDHSFVAEGFVVHNCCPRLDLAPTEEDTFEVAYTYGVGPEESGVLAAAFLACHIGYLMAPGQEGKCKLSPRARTVVRGGITLEFSDRDTADFGLPIVNAFVKIYQGSRGGSGFINPDQVAAASRTT